MLDDLMIGKFVAFYLIKQDMIKDNCIYRNVYKVIPAFLVSNNYIEAREEALHKRGGNITLISVEEITDKQTKKILKVFS